MSTARHLMLIVMRGEFPTHQPIAPTVNLLVSGRHRLPLCTEDLRIACYLPPPANSTVDRVEYNYTRIIMTVQYDPLSRLGCLLGGAWGRRSRWRLAAWAPVFLAELARSGRLGVVV